MSEFPQQADPDLHAIFGMDGAPNGGERVISVERGTREGSHIGAETDSASEVRVEADPGEISGAGLELDPLPGADVEFDTLGSAEPSSEGRHAFDVENAAQGG